MRGGDTVHLHTSLLKGQTYAFIEVFSAFDKELPSPHVRIIPNMVKKGQPDILKPTSIRLSEHNTSQVLSIKADQDCKFYLMQDIDVASDPLAKGKIWKDGKLYKIVNATSRWFSRNKRR